MTKRPRWIAAGVVIAALAALIPGGQPTAHASVTASQLTKATTLVSGDRVTLTPGAGVRVEPGPGRERMPFRRWSVNGHIHVAPWDATSLIASNRLDPRLFDVTALVAAGVGAPRRELPLIVTGASGPAAAIQPEEGKVVHNLPGLSMLAVRIAEDKLATWWNRLTARDPGLLAGGAAGLWLDAKLKPVLERSVPQIGGPVAWRAGLDGAGATVAVLDTGIDRAHPDLVGQVVDAADFTDGTEGGEDLVGHGTHVASTVAGTGAASGGRYRGVAPRARLLDAKVCTRDGCDESAVIAGMNWAAERGAKVVNLSLGGPDSAGPDPLERTVQELTDRYGTLFVAAAGNTGAAGSIGSPASADDALAVGAVDAQDRLTEFSGRGPRTGDFALKPDLVAPGFEIVAARSAAGELGQPGERYTALSGTSMATPHVAGAAAILAQRHPSWTGAQLKAGLMNSATADPATGAYDQGAGRVNIGQAIRARVVADSPSLSFGRQLWPHTDDPVLRRTITYRNTGDEQVTLSLELQFTGPNAVRTPTGMFALGVTSVTVPARGSTEVELTADTRVPAPAGQFTGRVRATDGTDDLTIPFAVDLEVESYDVTVSHLDAAGRPTADYGTLLGPTGGSSASSGYRVHGEGSEAKVRVPRGTYAVFSIVNGGDDTHPVFHLLARPRLTVEADLRLTVDARAARPVSIAVPPADAVPVVVQAAAAVTTGSGYFGAGVFAGTATDVTVGRIGDAVSDPAFVGMAGATFVKAGGSSLLPGNSPYVYHVALAQPSIMMSGVRRSMSGRDFAEVKVVGRHAGAPGAVTTGATRIAGLEQGILDPGLPANLPLQRTDYYATGAGVRWQNFFQETVPTEHGYPETVSLTYSAPTGYRSAGEYRQSWNDAVFGPTVGGPPGPAGWASRSGDVLTVDIPFFGDGRGHVGTSRIETGRTTVHHGSTKIGETDGLGGAFEVPAHEGEYRLRMEAVRGTPFVLSTSTTALWTFRSRRPAADEPIRLPLSTIRLTPPLDLHNTARAGRRLAIPVRVQGQPGAEVHAIRSLEVDVSFDDGRTWRSAPVRQRAGTGVVLVDHPADALEVALRATAADSAGNTVQQTTLRAYRVRR